MSLAINGLDLRHFRVETDGEGIIWLAMDYADDHVNRLSSEALAELGRVLDTLQQQPPAGLVIHSAKQAGFIAGANIDEFAGLDTPGKGMALVTRGWSLFNRLAATPYPTLALIQGHCLGGGLELSLACRYRLVVDQPETSLALPEVMLGIFPGWGGMLRLPALIGAPAALDMMLTGRPVNARKAYKLGLADGIVAPRLMRRAAAMLVRSGKPRRRAKGLPALLNHSLLRPLVQRQTLKSIDKRDPHHHYPAPRTILEIWAKHQGNALKAPELVDKLIQSDTVRNLVRVYHLQERLKDFGRQARPEDKAERVHVVGAGVMGGDIAAWAALKGMTVTLQDQDRQRIAAAQKRASALFTGKLKDPLLARAAYDRLIPDIDGHGVARADIVIEAITENPVAKRQLYQAIEPRLKSNAILATNTSSLSLEVLNQELKNPERLIGIHFFNPVAKMPLVEIVETPDSAPEALRKAQAFVGQLGKLGLPVKSTPGFLVNAVLAPYMLEAMRAYSEGISAETIDDAMVRFGMPMGPLELADTVGLDIVRDAGQQLSDQTQLPAGLQTRLDHDELGKKTGKGFYTWKEGKPIRGETRTPPSGLSERLIAPLLEKTRQQVENKVVADADLADAGVIFGTGFAPFTGGPMNYQRQLK